MKLLEIILFFFIFFEIKLISQEIEILKVFSSNDFPSEKITWGNLSGSSLGKNHRKNNKLNYEAWDISSMASLGPSNTGTRNELHRAEDIEKRIKYLKRNGVHVVILNGLHMHLCFLDKWKMWKENTKKIVKIAHKYGLKVIEHHDVPVIYNAGTGFKYFIKHLDRAQRDLQFNEVTHNMCLNNPAFRSEYLERLNDFINYTEVDGIMLDECYFAGSDFCGCDYCRSKFNKDTGLVLPYYQNIKNIIGQRNNILWLSWLKWRVKNTGTWWHDIKKTLNEVNKKASIFIYTTDSGLLYGSFLRQGFDIIEYSNSCDFIGAEIMSRNVFDCYRAVFGGRKLFSAFASQEYRPIFAWLYAADPHIAYFGWALCQMNRQSACIDINYKTNNYLNWPYRMQMNKVKPLADVALIFSPNSRYPEKEGAFHCKETLGLSQCLTDYHILHDIMFEHDITDRNIEKYKLIILGNCISISKNSLEIIKNYISNGGIAILTGHSTAFDNEGRKNNNFMFSDIMNISLISNITAPINIIHGNKLIPYDSETVIVKIKDSKLSKTYADISDQNGKILGPGVVETSYGKGKFIYISMLLGKINAQPIEELVGRKFKYEKSPQLHSFLKHIIKTAFNDFSIKINAPEKLLFSAYEQQKDSKHKYILLHFLNANSANLEKNEIIPPRKIGTPFPPLKKDMYVDFNLSGQLIKDAWIVSPDYAKKRDLEILRKTDNCQQVTIPKEDITSYSVAYIYIEKKE